MSAPLEMYKSLVQQFHATLDEQALQTMRHMRLISEAWERLSGNERAAALAFCESLYKERIK